MANYDNIIDCEGKSDLSERIYRFNVNVQKLISEFPENEKRSANMSELSSVALYTGRLASRLKAKQKLYDLRKNLNLISRNIDGCVYNLKVLSDVNEDEILRGKTKQLLDEANSLLTSLADWEKECKKIEDKFSQPLFLTPCGLWFGFTFLFTFLWYVFNIELFVSFAVIAFFVLMYKLFNKRCAESVIGEKQSS